MKSKPKLFGILNITPDSFSDGGLYLKPEKALQKAYILLEEGADFIDIGGESTNPQSKEITPEAEWQRLQPIITHLLQNLDLQNKISLDTKHPATAEKFCKLGGKIINDVSGFHDPKMRALAVAYETMVIVNHYPGKTLAEVHQQKIDDIQSVVDDLYNIKKILLNEGVEAEKIILDPGIGFGKTRRLNEALLKIGNLMPEEKILIGHSRKRFLGEKRFEIEPNLKAAKIALEHNARFLRIHDVAAHKTLLPLSVSK